MDLIKPYFMNNDNWYEITEDCIILTDEGKNIPKVVDSYNKYLKDLKDAE